MDDRYYRKKAHERNFTAHNGIRIQIAKKDRKHGGTDTFDCRIDNYRTVSPGRKHSDKIRKSRRKQRTEKRKNNAYDKKQSARAPQNAERRALFF